MEHHYKFNVAMSCGGCSGAVERVLKKLDGMLPIILASFQHGLAPFSIASPLRYQVLIPCSSGASLTRSSSAGVKSYDVSLDTQTADVVTAETLDYDTVLNTIKKTGKTVKSGEADGEERSVE